MNIGKSNLTWNNITLACIKKWILEKVIHIWVPFPPKVGEIFYNCLFVTTQITPCYYMISVTKNNISLIMLTLSRADNMFLSS